MKLAVRMVQGERETVEWLRRGSSGVVRKGRGWSESLNLAQIAKT